jgi:hypothetical protein
MDDLEHEFMLVKLEMELQGIEDLDTLRNLCLQLARMNEAQKRIFKGMFNVDMEEHDAI